MHYIAFLLTSNKIFHTSLGIDARETGIMAYFGECELIYDNIFKRIIDIPFWSKVNDSIDFNRIQLCGNIITVSTVFFNQCFYIVTVKINSS